MRIKIEAEIEVPPEFLAKPDIPRLVQSFIMALCAQMLHASAALTNGDGEGTGNEPRSSDPGTGATTGK